LASHQSVLIFDVLGASGISLAAEHPSPPAKAIMPYCESCTRLTPPSTCTNYQEAYNDAVQFKDEAISLFNFGYLSLPERAKVEGLYWSCCHRILELVRNEAYVPDDLENLEKSLAAIYYINLSVFQSAPDSWAIDQLFPIMPIHRLNEEPTCRATLADLTCDSDGKVEQFIDLRDVKPVLELHDLKPENPTAWVYFWGGLPRNHGELAQPVWRHPHGAYSAHSQGVSD
jgi:arginine decarboxylase